jgi:hypothetical protein
MGTIEQRIKADSVYPYGRMGLNPSGGCCAILKLGSTWASFYRPIWCSGKRLEDNAFCGRHDHLNWVVAQDEEYLMRALRRAGKKGLKFLSEASAFRRGADREP